MKYWLTAVYWGWMQRRRNQMLLCSPHSPGWRRSNIVSAGRVYDLIIRRFGIMHTYAAVYANMSWMRLRLRNANTSFLNKTVVWFRATSKYRLSYIAGLLRWRIRIWDGSRRIRHSYLTYLIRVTRAIPASSKTICRMLEEERDGDHGHDRLGPHHNHVFLFTLKFPFKSPLKFREWLRPLLRHVPYHVVTFFLLFSGRFLEGIEGLLYHMI